VSDRILAPLCALGKDVPEITTIGNITIKENPDCTIISLAERQGRATDLKKALDHVLAEGLPGPGRANLAIDISTIWTGNGQWFLTAPLPKYDNFAKEIKDMVAGTASIAEQTDGWVVFDIIGDGLIPFLERLCNINSKIMNNGDVTRTVIEHLGCLIICRESGRSFTIISPRSSAVSLHHTLMATAKSIS